MVIEKDILAYENRIVAFVDVLGFSALTQASRGSADAMSTLSEFVATNKIFEKFYQEVLDFGTATFFSDSFVVSMHPDQAWYLFRHTGQLCRYLLLKGLPCRGAVTVGPLHHVNNIVVGPALVDAHDFEQEAVFPRVVLDEGALALWREEFREGCAYPELNALLKFGDGKHFLDIFHPRWADSFQPWPEGMTNNSETFIRSAKSKILACQNASADNIRVKEKYDWLLTECAIHAS